MPFREKTAWIMAVLLTLAGLKYAESVWSGIRSAGAAPGPDIGLIALVTILLVAGAVVAHIIAAAVSPEDANAPEDERDKLVWWRAGNIAGWVLGFTAFAGLWHYYFRSDGDMLFHIIVGGLILGQIAEYAFVIVFYRRSWVI